MVRRLVGALSALILLIGLFAPVANTTLGPVRYSLLAEVNFKYLFFYAVLGIILSLFNSGLWPAVPAGLALIRLSSDYYDNFLSHANGGILQAVYDKTLGWEPSYGWLLMFAGAIALGISPFLPSSSD